MGGLNTYIVKAVSLKTTASGSYFNQSLGTRGSANFSVGIAENMIMSTELYPNPVKDKLFIDGHQFTFYQLYSLTGQLVLKGVVENNTINLSQITSGLYFISLTDNKSNSLKSKIIIE